MTVFDDDAQLFLDSGLMSEPVTLLLGTGAPRAVNAIVDRFAPETDPISDKQIRKYATVTISARAEDGMLPTEIVFGKLRVRLSIDRPGGPLGDYLAEMPTDGRPWADDGMIRLVVR